MKRIFYTLKKNCNMQSFIKIIKQNKLISLFIFFLLMGMVFGALSAKNASSSIIESLDFLFASNFKNRETQSMFTTFIASLNSLFIFVFFIFLLGLCMFGVVVIPASLFFRGFGLGITAGFLYSMYGAKGILFHLIVILPGVFLSSIAIIIEAKESLIFCSRLISKVLPKAPPEKLWPYFKTYLIKTGYIFIIITICAALDMLLNSIFAHLFSF